MHRKYKRKLTEREFLYLFWDSLSCPFSCVNQTILNSLNPDSVSFNHLATLPMLMHSNAYSILWSRNIFVEKKMGIKLVFPGLHIYAAKDTGRTVEETNRYVATRNSHTSCDRCTWVNFVEFAFKLRDDYGFYTAHISPVIVIVFAARYR